MNQKSKVFVCNLNGKLVFTEEDVDFCNFTLSEANFPNAVNPGNYIIMMIDNVARKMHLVARVDVEETVTESTIVAGDCVFDHKTISYPVKVYTDLCPGFAAMTIINTPDKLMEFAELYNNPFYFEHNEFIQYRFRRGQRSKRAVLVQRMF